MRMSKLFARTLRDAPADAEAPSHQLLVRAAFVRQLMSGVYTTLPLGVRSMRKIEAIVRQEMDAAGAQELRMPIVLPSEPWEATGRWQTYGDELFRLADRHGRTLLLGPTQEEVVTPLVTQDFGSYRDLPVNLYQIEWKYRDERRPRFGLLRGREFLMKDAYSFDRNAQGLQESYRIMFDSYGRIFDRCGLDCLTVEADAGSIGGDVNHEFMAKADVGEDLYVACVNGDYLVDTEAATPAAPAAPEAAAAQELAPLEVVDTPGTSSITALAALLAVPEATTLKAMLYLVGQRPVMVLVPGDREVNEHKLASLHFPEPVRAFEEEDFKTHGLIKGFVGPHGLPGEISILADHAVLTGSNWVAGANVVDQHATGVNVDRDFTIASAHDLVQIREGDRCPVDGGELEIGRSIVVGHIYQLGTRYSLPLKARFTEEDGTEQLYEMGCYGIGISRILAAVAEQYNDERGLRWPKALAPYEIVVVAVNRDDERVWAEAERIYNELSARGIEVVLDDREASPGVKFNDADLIGFPVQVAVGKRGVEAGAVDVKIRATGEKRQSPLAEVVQAAIDALAEAP